MKTNSLISVLFILFYFSYTNASVEERKASDIVAKPESKIRYYQLETGYNDAVVLSMPYGEPTIITETDKKKINSSQVLKIDLVFSDFPKKLDFKKLNLKRIQALEKIRKNLISDPTFEWKIIRQTGCSNEAEAQTMFHGIVIHIRKPQDEETIKMDFLVLDNYVSKDSTAKTSKMLDSTIFKVLKRNDKWNDMLIVSDLTGSMAPYTAQFILWFKLASQQKRVKDVVFFNDGDMTPDNEKVIGETGGIYHQKVKSFEDLIDLAHQTMRGGGGGDSPENNIEALLKAIEISPNAKEIVMIADNLANIKDISLMEKLNKPVHIILCGTLNGLIINLQYLELARKTGGSVHTMEEDLTDLVELNEGEKITFSKKTFQIVGGKFVELKKI